MLSALPLVLVLLAAAVVVVVACRIVRLPPILGYLLAGVAAGPVFRLLGAKEDLGVTDDYMKEKMPAVNVSLLNGHLAWRQHDGGHTDGPNWKYFIPWASEYLKYTPKW